MRVLNPTFAHKVPPTRKRNPVNTMTARKPQTHNLWSILLLFVMIFSSNTAGATESFEPQPREPWQLDSIADYLHLRGGVADVGFGLGREDERWLSGGNTYDRRRCRHNL